MKKRNGGFGKRLVKKGHGEVWTSNEDRILKLGVERYGLNSWRHIAAALLRRKTARACKERWENVVNPNLKIGWKHADEEMLCDLAKVHNSQWTTIADMLNRPASQCLAHYRLLVPDSRDPSNIMGPAGNPESDTAGGSMDVAEKKTALERVKRLRKRKAKIQARKKRIEKSRMLVSLLKRESMSRPPPSVPNSVLETLPDGVGAKPKRARKSNVTKDLRLALSRLPQPKNDYAVTFQNDLEADEKPQETIFEEFTDDEMEQVKKLIEEKMSQEPREEITEEEMEQVYRLLEEEATRMPMAMDPPYRTPHGSEEEQGVCDAYADKGGSTQNLASLYPPPCALMFNGSFEKDLFQFLDVNHHNASLSSPPKIQENTNIEGDEDMKLARASSMEDNGEEAVNDSGELVQPSIKPL